MNPVISDVIDELEDNGFIYVEADEVKLDHYEIVLMTPTGEFDVKDKSLATEIAEDFLGVWKVRADFLTGNGDVDILLTVILSPSWHI
tara:strand:+ start:1213 stop:1476 length:264 start_codon:yes stop_codon:yes gene_type:complete